MSSGGISLQQLQDLLGESELQVQVNGTSTASDKWDIGIASLEISETEHRRTCPRGSSRPVATSRTCRRAS